MAQAIKYHQNLFMVHLPDTNGSPDFDEGLSFRQWEDRKNGGWDLVVHFGIGDRFTAIKLSKSHQPHIDYKNEKVLSGAFKEVNDQGRRRLVISALDSNDKAIYVAIVTGLDVGKGDEASIEMAVNRYIMNGGANFFTPGCFSMDGASSMAGMSDGLLTEEKVKKIKGLGAKGHRLVGGSIRRVDFWRIAVGSEVLVQEINGLLYRVCNEDGQIAIRDANTEAYAELFAELLKAHREQVAKMRKEKEEAAKKAAKSDAQVPPTEQVLPADDAEQPVSKPSEQPATAQEA